MRCLRMSKPSLLGRHPLSAVYWEGTYCPRPPRPSSAKCIHYLAPACMRMLTRIKATLTLSSPFRLFLATSCVLASLSSVNNPCLLLNSFSPFNRGATSVRIICASRAFVDILSLAVLYIVVASATNARSFFLFHQLWCGTSPRDL